MAHSPRTIPANYPQPLGNQLVRVDWYRQASMVRQEILTDLLSILADAHEPAVRQRLIKMIESNLKLGLHAAHKATQLWPALEEVKATIEKNGVAKPAVAKKQLKLFEQFDAVQHRSLALLENSFENIRVILDRMQPPAPTPPPAKT